ncbi:hypothetical protein [Leucothrix arctica]|uniref:Glycosyl transferase family 51 domain-containing protein n=1 Tax=Leucothrix arctica TaxID=1481894 RepID=A0A317CJY2_9GAMM|nr:hypothetical protein [Leucothrix arctica]PWQ98894.1 hypothetical protein DKT75_01655 [Leucothrix arctica]
MYLALLKVFFIGGQAIDWVRLHALRYFAHPLIQNGSGNSGERAAKLPLKDWRYGVSIVLALIESVVRSIWQVFRWMFFLNTRSVLEFLLSGVKLVIVLAVLSVASLYGYLSGEPDARLLAHYQSLHQTHTATAVLGQRGSLIGAMTHPKAAEGTESGLYTEMVPPVYWDILDYKTGRKLDFSYQDTSLSDLLFLRKSNYKGAAVSDIMTAFNPFDESEKESLLSQLSKTLNDQKEAGCFGLFDRLCNTLSSIRLARHTFPYLAQNNGAEFKRWVAIHGPLRGHGDDLKGLRTVADVVFKKLPEQLSNAEQSIMAIAQLQAQPLLDLENWDDLIQQAEVVSGELYTRQQPRLVNNIRADLKALKAPKPVLITGVKTPQEVLNLPYLMRRGELLLGSFATLVTKSLEAEYSRTTDSQLISDIQLSLPVTENAIFQAKLQSRLASFERRCKDCGLRRILGESPDKGGAQIQVMVADQAGQIVRYFTRGEVNPRAIGALSAIPASVLLVSENNKPSDLFCNQTYRNLPSSVEGFSSGIVNCDTLQEKGHAISFQQAIQARASLPLFYALRKNVDGKQVQGLYRDFGLTDLRSREGNPSHAEQLAYEMSYGVVQSTPLRQLEVIHQLSEILYGDGNPRSVMSISQFLVTDLQERKRYLEFSKIPSPIVINGNYLRTNESKTFLKQLLNYDVNTKTGPLKSLRKLNNVRFLLTKSGQTYTKQLALRDQWLVASVLIRGKRYSISAFVGSPVSDGGGLANKLSAADIFTPIVSEIVADLD